MNEERWDRKVDEISICLGEYMIVLDPSGGKVREIVHSHLDRNLLFAPAAPYILEMDNGPSFEIAGWDEACPTVAESLGIPRLGWAWRTTPEMDRLPNSHRAIWRLPQMTLEREMTSDGDLLTSSYLFQNTGSEAIPFLWAGHVLYAVDGLQDICMPGSQLAPGPGCQVQELETQIIRRDGAARAHGFSDIGQSWKFFVPADAPVDLNYQDATLRIHTTAPWLGVFLNRGRFGPPCLGIEPTTHPTDDAENAALLSPGGTERFSWSLEVVSTNQRGR